MTWKGVAVVQVNQLHPIWDGLKRKRKEIDLFGSTQLKPAATATRLLKPKLPMRHYRKLPIPEKEPEKKLEEAEKVVLTLGSNTCADLPAQSIMDLNYL